MFGNIFNQLIPGQLYHVNQEGGRTVLAEPSDQFSSAVFYYWLMRIDDAETNLEVIPDAALDLVVSPLIPQFSVIYPPVIKKFSIPLNGPALYAGISFEPEAAQHFFDTDLNTMATLEPGPATTKALNLGELTDAIQGVTDIHDVKTIFDRELITKNFKPVKRLQQSVYQSFVEKLDAGGAREVAQRIGISERQFRRTINDISGLSPKQVQRIVRLQQLLHEIFNAGAVTADDGFYDDSHRIREMKELTGLTYGELRKMAEIYNKTK